MGYFTKEDFKLLADIQKRKNEKIKYDKDNEEDKNRGEELKKIYEKIKVLSRELLNYSDGYGKYRNVKKSWLEQNGKFYKKFLWDAYDPVEDKRLYIYIEICNEWYGVGISAYPEDENLTREEKQRYDNRYKEYEKQLRINYPVNEVIQWNEEKIKTITSDNIDKLYREYFLFYKEVFGFYPKYLRHLFSEKHLKFLRSFLEFPNNETTAKEIAKVMGYKGYRGANAVIGAIGEIIYELGIYDREDDILKKNEIVITKFINGEDTDEDKIDGPWSYVCSKEGFKWKLRPMIIEALGLDEDDFSDDDYNYDEKMLENVNERIPEKQFNKGADKGYKKSNIIRQEAKERDGYKCCIDSTHSFYQEDGHKYVEVHHIIPMSAQDKINVEEKENIDRTGNVVSLCPNCHKAVHNGSKKEKEKRLKKIYDYIAKKDPKKWLSNRIEYEDLLKKYYWDKK